MNETEIPLVNCLMININWVQGIISVSQSTTHFVIGFLSRLHFFLVQEYIHRILEFAPKIKAILLESWRSFEPTLHEFTERWLRFRAANLVDSILIMRKYAQIMLVVLDTMLSFHAQFVLQQAKLHTLKA